MSDDAQARPGLRGEALDAARNALKLGGSLILTWGVAVGIRLLLPRHLGPEAFGLFNFADAFTTTLFAFLSLGVDTYIRREVARRPEHASDFFLGVWLVRVAAAGLLVLGALAVLHGLGRPPEVLRVVAVFGAAQLFVITNLTLSAVLQARGKVGGLSISNVVTKVLWGGGILIAIRAGGGLASIAAALALSEAVRTVVLSILARRHAQLRLSWNPAATWAVIVACVPLYLNVVARGLYERMDVTLLAFAAASEEVGFYGAANNLAGLTLMLSPLMGWVLLPLLSRAAAISHQQLAVTARGALEMILAVAVPTALILGLGAEYWTRWLFGEAFAPAAGALTALAPMFVSTYVAMIAANVLIVQDRAWTVTAVTAANAAIHIGLNLTLVPLFARGGAGGAGVGAALALMTTELIAAAALMTASRQTFFERGMISRVLRLFAAAAVTVLLDHELKGLGPVRLVIDVSFYAGAVLLTGAVRTREIIAFARAALRRKDPCASPSQASSSAVSPSPSAGA